LVGVEIEGMVGQEMDSMKEGQVLFIFTLCTTGIRIKGTLKFLEPWSS